MDLDRPHFRTTSIGSSSSTAAPTPTTSELFICFTSRLSSSSSMKLARSILSPARAASLSSSLSRRLRSNGSIKGGQASPFFNTTGKKRGCGFDNPEPSSPKVTCIGQVRVKTKKKVKHQTRSLSRRRSGGGGAGSVSTNNGEVSFRKIEQADGEDRVRYSNASAHYQQGQQQGEGLHPHRNQRWVHLPVSICEALREFSCLFPCKSSCFSTGEREKGEKQGHRCGGSSRENESGCGAVFARWLVSVNDGEGGKRREIELVVGGGDDEVEERAVVERMSPMRSSRRHVFEDIEVKDDNSIEVKGQSVEGEEEAARVSICVPPKNALLLMRCRSDPMKMADLAHRFSWDAHAAATSKNKEYEDKGGEVDEDFEAQIRRCEGNYEVLERDVAVAAQSSVGQEIAEADLETEVGGVGHVEEIGKEELVTCSEEMVVEEEEREELEQEIEVNQEVLAVEEAEEEEEEEEEVESNMSSFEALLDQESADHYVDCPTHDMEEVVADSPICHLSSSSSSESDEEEDNFGSNEVTSPHVEEEDEAAAATEEKLGKQAAEKDAIFVNNDEEKKLETEPETTHRKDEGKQEEEVQQQTTMPPTGLTTNQEKEDSAISNQETKKEKESPVLPDCLLLMMCEPKLSMEVSKETWVCSTDFTRWLPERPRKAAKSSKPGGGCPHEPVKKRLSTDSKPTKPIPDAIPAPQNNNDHRQHLQQPPRSSCSLPMAAKAASMATTIEQKVANAVAIEPFVLTRCKSEPMRTAAAKLMPEPCLWKNAVRKLEPHRHATVGVGAAGVGF